MDAKIDKKFLFIIISYIKIQEWSGMTGMTGMTGTNQILRPHDRFHNVVRKMTW